MDAAKLLMLVAHGEAHRASLMLRKNPKLLLAQASVCDYSARTFNCTAYEYAY